MRWNRICATIISLVAFTSAGTFLPSAPVIVNERSEVAQVNPTKYGYIAMVLDSSLSNGLRVDVKNLASGEKYRIALNPSFENTIDFSIFMFVVSHKVIPHDVFTTKVVLEQLQPGDYVTQYLYLGKTDGKSLVPDTFHVRPGKITSLGSLHFQGRSRFILGCCTDMEIRTVHPLDDSLFQPFVHLGINVHDVVHSTISWKEK